MERSQRKNLIERILAQTPYMPESEKHHTMAEDLDKLQFDTLLILHQSQKGVPPLGSR